MGVLHVFLLFLLLAFTQPTENPTPEASGEPTVAPTTAEPTDAPIEPNEPTVAPTTTEPTVAPTTAEPTAAPTKPNDEPTVAPTAVPTAVPTAPTTATPTSAPTPAPTAVPTVAPTTAAPTPPTVAPTAAPTGVPTPPTTPAPTSLPCYTIHINGGETVYLCDTNSTNVEFADSWGTTQFDFQSSSAWLRLSNVTIGSVFVLEVSSLVGITAKFYDELGLLNLQTNNYPQFGTDIKKDGKGFFSQIQFPQGQIDRLFLYIEAVNKTATPKLGRIDFTSVFAANYSFNNTFPSKSQDAPLVSKIGSNSYLFANWVFPQLGNEEGLNYLQVTASCDNQKINVMEVYISHCGTGVDCTYPVLSAENRLSMNFSLTSIPEKPSFTYQLGFPTDAITEKNTKLLVTIRNPTSSLCSVSVDSYVAKYQVFTFNSFRTYGYSSDYPLYVNRYQPFRVADTTNVVMTFDLHDSPNPQISMFFSDNAEDRAQNKEVSKPFYIYNATGDNVISFPSGAAAPHKSFSIYNSGIDKKSTFSLLFSVKGAFSWGYYAVIALGVGLVALTAAFVVLMRPKNGEYEPLQQLS